MSEACLAPTELGGSRAENIAGVVEDAAALRLYEVRWLSLNWGHDPAVR